MLGGKLGVDELSIAFQQVSYYMVTLASGNDQPVNIWQVSHCYLMSRHCFMMDY